MKTSEMNGEGTIKGSGEQHGGWFKSFDAVFELQIERDERFKLTEQSLEKMRAESVPSAVLEKLEEAKGAEVEGEKKFLAKMARKIGEEATAQYQALILKHAHKKEKGVEALSCSAKIVYLALCRRANRNRKAKLPHARIAQDCSISPAAVKRALDDLCRINLIEIESHKASRQVNEYTLTEKEEWYKAKEDKEDCSSTRATETEESSSEKATSSSLRPTGLALTELPRTTNQDYTRRTTQPKRERNSSLELEKEEWVRQYYARLRNPHISNQELQQGVSVINRLLKDGCTEEQISFALQWIPEHIPTAYSINILPKVIGQALHDEATLKKEREAKRRRREINNRALEREIAKLDAEAAQMMRKRGVDPAMKEAA